MIDVRRTSRRVWITAALAWLAVIGAPAFAAPGPDVPPAVQDQPGPGCKHDWKRSSSRKWIPPVKQKVLVGRDKNGKPIYQEREVQPGRWEIVYEDKCRKCGKVKKG